MDVVAHHEAAVEFNQLVRSQDGDHPVVVIMRSGREYNVVIDGVGQYFVDCHVGLVQEILLVSASKGSSVLSLCLDNPGYIAALEKEYIAHGCNVFVKERVFVKGVQKMILRLDEIAVHECLGLPYFPNRPVTSTGMLDYSLIVEVVPGLAHYYNGTDGFFHETPNVCLSNRSASVIIPSITR